MSNQKNKLEFFTKVEKMVQILNNYIIEFRVTYIHLWIINSKTHKRL